jgi:membrane protease YdiL (CAAX protease family)
VTSQLSVLWGQLNLAFPTFTDVVISVVILLVGAAIVYLVSKAFKLHPKPIVISDTKKEAKMAFLVIAIVSVATSVLVVFYRAIFNPLPKFDPLDVLLTIFFYALWFLPMVIVMKRTGQNRASIGINRENIGRTLVLGLTLSAVLFVAEGFLAPSLGRGFTGFSTSLGYAFIIYAIVGFSEETVWRGYIQTRLTAYGGTLKGLVATSILFSLLHFPAYYYQLSGVPLEALASSLLLFPVILLFGYIMLRCQNVISSSVFHLFYDLAQAFWQISS